MKLSYAFSHMLLACITLCCLMACEKDYEQLSSIQETTFEGEASTLEISINGNDWQIASVTDLDGQYMNDKNNKPMHLEDMGSMHFNWGTISRNKQDALTIELNNNFDETDRAFIVNLELRAGFYREQITIHQKQCQNFYQIESMVYTLEEGDKVKEATTRPWGFTYIDKIIPPGQITTITYYPIYLANVECRFECQTTEFHQNWLSSKKEDHKVSMPKGIENGEITFEEEKRNYADKSKYFSKSIGESYDVDIVGWKRNILSSNIYYKQLRVTYTMTLSRPGSDALKTVKGKLIKEFPYDCSPVRHQVSEMKEEDYKEWE